MPCLAKYGRDQLPYARILRGWRYSCSSIQRSRSGYPNSRASIMSESCRTISKHLLMSSRMVA
eukprot:9358074-Pyramimonas_sp.AAC.1